MIDTKRIEGYTADINYWAESVRFWQSRPTEDANQRAAIKNAKGAINDNIKRLSDYLKRSA